MSLQSCGWHAVLYTSLCKDHKQELLCCEELIFGPQVLPLENLLGYIPTLANKSQSTTTTTPRHARLPDPGPLSHLVCKPRKTQDKIFTYQPASLF